MCIENELKNKWLPVLQQETIKEEQQEKYEEDLKKYKATLLLQL